MSSPYTRLAEIVKVQSILRSQSRSRLVGANSPGMISAVGNCRLGFHPLPFFRPGNVGVIAKSGTLSYETVASITRAGLGQSLVIGMGGDPLPGTDFVDALRVFEHDDDTKGIILVGEIGGEAEIDAAEWITQYRQRTPNPKYVYDLPVSYFIGILFQKHMLMPIRPIMALIAGVQSPRSRVMGHAGALVRAGEKSANAKVQALTNAGVIMVNHPSKFGEGMKHLLNGHQNTSIVRSLSKISLSVVY